jgi:hypothetical protein
MIQARDAIAGLMHMHAFVAEPDGQGIWRYWVLLERPGRVTWKTRKVVSTSAPSSAL